MSDSPNLALPFLAAGQAQKHVTLNDALMMLDALVQCAVESRTLAAPPAEPVDGQRFVVAGSGAGDWAGQGGAIAVRVDGGWRFITPREGWQAFVRDEGAVLGFLGGAWLPGLARTAHGGALSLHAIEAEVTLAGASVVSPLVIESRRICLGVASRTIQAITGATSFKVGIAGEPAKFGDLLGITEGASNIGIIGPTGFYADTPVVIAANGGAFTGGRLRLVLYALGFTAPAA
ncbi:DUF2793 domain-containing protein [Blastochloris sulfoviridis]|uniref:DUF2793 domain-containing protein n=1 Tax=Blastochloris sulfoviridis TaxID=50712 RepID=A0A5M6HVB2_9HYPH|nr:DUF2793 domain-containing protein [Blastochloris sulfoviridis]KAA5599843.1 DUF2793 domain-containing protein [Blastochloris sulfoviridis]